MPHRFEELIAWQRARSLAASAATAVRTSRLRDDYRLADQLLRATRSVPANIAEGFERNARREFHRFLGIAKGSAGEARAHLYTAYDASLISRESFESLLGQCEEVSRLIAGLRRTVKTPHKPPT
ncbi:MAG TPA: four helix bundle protein [Gemmatimonadales bacterium]|nr:four helix bundle protein [Gemmatimonadales bacterium]